MPMTYAIAHLDTPVGIVEITGNADGIVRIRFLDEQPDQLLESADLHDCARQLDEYFSGSRREFHSLRLRFPATDFQRSVWDALMDVPFGETVSYGELAQRAGYAGAARAVGTAMNVNPLTVVIPCHRVLPANRTLGEYAGGVQRKLWLLQHEAMVQ